MDNHENPADFAYYQRVLQKAGVVFAAPLTREEIRDIEAQYHFQFPPDLREFLMFALPISNGFVNWRDSTEREIVDRLGWPLVGMCFDIQNNSFWPAAWGERPSSLEEAFEIARKVVKTAPALIPIRGHRYIPDRPHEPGNPVFSVYQTDVIYYGSDLFDYLENEFSYYFRGPGEHYGLGAEIRAIEFWSELVRWNESV
jgi:hypothetical protein